MNNNGYTYETDNRTTPLETYEWDNTWYEHADDTEKPRVLYVGDSISCGVRSYLNMGAKGEMYFDGFGTSKAVDNAYFKAALSIFGKQQWGRAAVIFNSGLHGWHLTTDEYTRYYEDMLKFLIDEYKYTPIAVLTTTSVADAGRDVLVHERNAAVTALAKKYNLPVIDIYGLSKALEWSDGVHFTPESYEQLAAKILDDLKKII